MLACDAGLLFVVRNQDAGEMLYMMREELKLVRGRWREGKRGRGAEGQRGRGREGGGEAGGRARGVSY